MIVDMNHTFKKCFHVIGNRILFYGRTSIRFGLGRPSYSLPYYNTDNLNYQ